MSHTYHRWILTGWLFLTGAMACSGDPAPTMAMPDGSLVDAPGADEGVDAPLDVSVEAAPQEDAAPPGDAAIDVALLEDVAPPPDAPPPDATLDAPSPDAAPDAPPPDASPDAAPDGAAGVVVVQGRVTHERRVIRTTGLDPVTSGPTVGVSVELVSSDGTARSTRVITDADGRFTLNGTGAAGEMISVRVLALRSDATYQLSIQNFAEAVYSVTTSPFPAGPAVTRDVAIPEGSNAGAFVIFDTLRRGLDFVRSTLPRPPPALPVRWERGRETPGGTSYFSQGSGAIFILGGPMDADEYDTPVLLHEFGHFVEFNYSHSDSPGGDHDGSPTSPLLAWGEGFGTWFGCAANDSPVYLDSTVDGSITLARDLSALPLERNYLGVATEPLTQMVGEYLVGGSLWAITNAGADRRTQIGRQLAVLLRYFSRTPIPDRGVPGVDFVDFLDGYECLHGTGDRTAIRAYVVTQRNFPYDFAGATVCP